ncbi:MAG: 2-hydroxyacyl-CoA dehydratase family protein [Polyangia bacterium]|jgi:benzoyl-CoA reductase/2-hydroxyglutaryl-CoA dehydratase subunit BcrC/BadD/HgdB|nr:2-hydroxyacyl-CoA dehydratase family protein [Polyangia bacterium]
MITRRAQYEAVRRVVGPFLAELQAWQRRYKRLRRRGGKPKESPFGPPLESVGPLKDLMTRHYLEGRYADGAVPVAWVTSGFPVELLRALGYHTLYPENHAALCGVQRLTPEYSDRAERDGYSRCLCSYARTDIGGVLLDKTPAGRLPRPDLLACCTNICQTVLYWYRCLADHFKVPLVLIDTPFVYGEAQEHDLTYVRDQLAEALTTAERVAGRSLDWDQLARVVRLAQEGSVLWGECLAESRQRPAPWTGFDGFFHIAPIVALRGTEGCNAYYRHLLDELRDRVKKGIGGVRSERFRLMWDNLPIWFNVRELSTQLAEQGFNIVVTTYTNAWAEAGRRIDPDDIFGSAASAYTNIILNEDLDRRLALMKRLAAEYQVDGALLHSDRSCKPYSIGQVDLKDRLGAELGIKALLLEADHNDPRAYSSEQGATRLQAFMEGFQ